MIGVDVLLVYVIENDEYLRTVIGEYLQSRGFSILNFENEEEAFRCLHDSKKIPSLIVLNAEQPNGIKFLDEMSSNDFSMPVYVMYKNEDTLPRIMSSNIISGRGPIHLEEMVNVINNHLRFLKGQ